MSFLLALLLLGSSEVAPVRCAATADDMRAVQAIEGQILGAFSSTSSAQLLEHQDLQLRSAPRDVSSRFDAAMAKATSGRDAYRKLQLQSAARDLDASQSELRKILPWLEDAGLSDVLLDLGLVQVETGDRESAEKTFRAARFYGAPSALDPKFFPEVAMKAYAKGSAAAEATGLGSIAIRTRPTGAEVFVDGRSVGKGPVVVDNVVVGAHVIRVQAEGRSTWTRIQVVDGQAHTITVRVPKSPINGDIALTGDPDRDFQRQLQTGEIVGARFVLAYGIDSNQRAFVRVIDVLSGRAIFHQLAEAGAEPAALRALAQDGAAATDAAAGAVVEPLTVD